MDFDSAFRKTSGVADDWALFRRTGLAEADHAVPFLPLCAFAKEFNALEALEDVSLGTQGRGASETSML
jgi:hypothetical protein